MYIIIYIYMSRKNRGAGDWYTMTASFICCKRGKQTPLFINQPMGKGHLCARLQAPAP